MIELIARLERSIAVLGPIDSLVVLGEHFADISTWFEWLHLIAAGTTVAAVAVHHTIKLAQRIRVKAV